MTNLNNSVNNVQLQTILATSKEKAIKYFNTQINEIEGLAQFLVEDGMSLSDAINEEVNEWNADNTVADLILLLIALDNVGEFKDIDDSTLDMTVKEYCSINNLDSSLLPFGQENRSNNGTCIDRSVANRGNGNLSKNVTSSVTTINNTKDSLMTNSTAFTNAFDAKYSEVSPLINFGIADKFINFEGEGQSFAEMLANIMYTTQEFQKPLRNETEEDVKSINETIANKNARSEKNRINFLKEFNGKLGYIVKHTLHFNNVSDYAKSSYKLKKHFESLFTMAEAPIASEDVKYKGLAFDESAPYVNIAKMNASSIWIAMLAKATFNLSIEERVQLLGLLFHDKAQVNGTIISRDKISIDLELATVTTSSRTLKANKASCFGMTGKEDFIILDGCHSIFLFALQALGGTVKQLETSINLAVKLFKPEHNYGQKPNANDIAHFVQSNLVYTNTVKSTSFEFPSVEIIGGKQNPKFLGYILSRGVIATSDKTNTKFITINAGAEATGVGYSRTEDGSLDKFFTANDTNKATKLFNRPAANNYTCAQLEDRVMSNFGFALSNGEVARTQGKMMKVAYTNSLLTFGSGVGIINVDTKFNFSIDKKEEESINLSLFGAEYLDNVKAKTKVVSAIEKAINNIVGNVVKAGDMLLTLEVNEQEFALVSNSEKAADVVVKGGFVKDNVLDENSIDIIVEVALIANTGFVKTRRFATKFTTLPYEAEFVGMNNEWDIILNNECTKGHGALLEMFANATGERFLNNSTQEFTTPEGESFNLMDSDNEFYQWRDSNIVKDVKLTMSIAKSVWENQARFCTNTVEVIAETTDVDGNPCVVVEETVDVLFGELVFDVEISTALESVSNSNLTLESASAVYLQSKRLGNLLFEDCIAKADKFVALGSRFAGTDRSDMVVVDLEDDESFNDFIESLPSLKNFTQRQILSAVAVKYPAGIQFLVGEKVFSINLGLIATFGQFNKINGSAARETGDIVNFLLDVLFNGADKRSKLVVKAKRAAAKILKTAVDSNKVLKKPTRSGKLIYGKVRTSFHPMLHSEDGIPTVVMNINCPMVKMLGIPTDGSVVNYYVGFARTPMPFLGGARIKLTADSNICEVAHVLVDAYVWHQLNEGDSDGDGIALLNLSKLGFTMDEVHEINNSIMGIAGYEHLYGTNVPFADFVSEEDKAGKKSFRGELTLISTKVKNPDTGNKEEITVKFVGDFANRVATHYKTAVGTSYGICSALVFKAADWAAAGDEDMNEVMTSTLIAWRAIYEGLGLSGYSAKAERIFDIINFATMDFEGHRLFVNDQGDVGCIWDQGLVANPDYKATTGSELLQEEFSEFNAPIEVFEYILDARCHTKAAVRLEGFGKALSKKQKAVPNLINGAIKYGTLRRISQGQDRVFEELGLVEEATLAQSGEHVGVALTRRFDQIADTTMSENFSNQKLLELATKVCAFHKDLLVTKAALLDEEV